MVACLALALGLWLAGAGVALAHAELTGSAPAEGAVLDSAPPSIELTFSESASLQFSTLKLYDRSHREIYLGPLWRVGGSENTLAANIQETMPPGRYTVVWRAVSSDDGHLTDGSYAFSVGSAGGGQAGVAGPTEEIPTPRVSEGAQGSASVMPPMESMGAAPSGPTDGQQSQGADPLRWALRAVILACAALLLGGSVFGALISPHRDSETEPTSPDSRHVWHIAERRFTRAAIVASCILLVALVLDLAFETSAIQATGLDSGLSGMALAGRVIVSTGYGLAWFLELGSAAILLALVEVAWIAGGAKVASGATAVVKERELASVGTLSGGAEGIFGTVAAIGESGEAAGRAPEMRGLWGLTAAVGAVLVLGEALGSHAAAGQGAPAVLGVSLPLISYWAHVVAAYAWAGGLAYMLFALFPAMRVAGIATDERRLLLARSVPAFSRLALLSVGVLTVTGIYNLLQHTTDLGAIVASLYGQVLAVKTGAFVALIALGAVNLLRLTPLLQGRSARRRPGGVAQGGDEAASPARLRDNIRFEIALMLLVLACAGGMSLLRPPAAPAGAASGQQTTPPPARAIAP